MRVDSRKLLHALYRWQPRSPVQIGFFAFNIVRLVASSWFCLKFLDVQVSFCSNFTVRKSKMGTAPSTVANGNSVIAIPKSLSYLLTTDPQGTSAHLRLPAIVPIEVNYKYTCSTVFFWNKLCTNMNIKYVNRYIHAFSSINHRCFANMHQLSMFNMQLNKPCFTCISMGIMTGCLLSRGGRSTMAITEWVKSSRE